MAEMNDAELLAALGVDSQAEESAVYTPREERILAGFEEIQRFAEKQGRAPMHGEDRDIFERIYAMRLDRIRALEECRALAAESDCQGLLDERSGGEDGLTIGEPVGTYGSDAALLAELGVDGEADNDIGALRFVKSRADKRAAEEIARREPCEDFARFAPLFKAVQRELDQKLRVTKMFRDHAEVRRGDWFILGGQKVYVADIGEAFVTDYDRRDRRLRVIYDNGTESDMLMRSLQRALNKDPTARRIIDTSPGPLFASLADEHDVESGTIYVLRSLSDDPFIAEHRDVIHKIGVTGGDVDKRIANAGYDATFLLADVEVVATYELFNINRRKLEKLIHAFFQPARLDLRIGDRFGHAVTPREWFLAPLQVIDEVVEKLRDGTISAYRYEVETASLRAHENGNDD